MTYLDAEGAGRLAEDKTSVGGNKPVDLLIHRQYVVLPCVCMCVYVYMCIKRQYMGIYTHALKDSIRV
jgi:hypothetical protein